MGEITQWLRSARAGDAGAFARVFDALYPELRRIARSRLDSGERTLTPTALVHEAFVRMTEQRALTLHDRRHFLACAAKVMRAIVIDRARRRHADKRGGGDSDVPLDALPFELAGIIDDEQLLALDECLKLLDAVSARQLEVVELRYFAGLEYAEIAELLDCSERTAKREWERARAFLYERLQV